MTEPLMFRKKPVTIEAMHYNGEAERATEIINWALSSDQTIRYWCGDGKECRKQSHVLQIPTLEGVMTALPGDWIIKGVQGEFYPCKPDIFEATYEVAK
ncbi:MAG: hypothetical protein ACTH2A_06775 [Glutamicibacter ardleyensis]